MTIPNRSMTRTVWSQPRPKLSLAYPEVALISECEGVFIVEPMRFLWPSQAKAIARREARRSA